MTDIKDKLVSQFVQDKLLNTDNFDALRYITATATDPRKPKNPLVDPYEEGNVVGHICQNAPGSTRWIVKECCGTNFNGDFEYCIESLDGIKKGYSTYVSDYEIHNFVLESEDRLPELPNEEELECRHENAYKNVVSRTLQFWVCPDCKKEVKGPGSKSKKLSQKEIDSLIDDFQHELTELSKL